MKTPAPAPSQHTGSRTLRVPTGNGVGVTSMEIDMAFLNPSVERTCLFIDGANLWASATALGIRIDYIKFLKFFQPRGTYLAGARYFTAVDTDANGKQNLRPLLDFLSHNGYTIITKEAKSYEQEGRERKIKGNMDVEFTIDVLDVCVWLDRVILVTGDGDFKELVCAVKKRGRKVTVVSADSLLSSDLRKEADQVINLAEIMPLIT